MTDPVSTVTTLRWIESDRLAALGSYEILDTPAEDEFDELARLAARVCMAPAAVISLIDENRQWFKAKYNHDACETARSESICAHAITGDTVFVVPDLRTDPRFARLSVERSGGPAPVRSYAGAPIFTPDGLPLGTVCVVDFVPRHFEARQLESLETIARQVTAQLELRKSRLALARSERETQLAITASSVVGSWEWEPASRRIRGDARFAALHGEPVARYENPRTVTEHLNAVHPQDRPKLASFLTPAFRSGDRLSIEYRSHDGERWLSMEGETSGADQTRYTGVLIDVTARKEIEFARRDEAVTIDALYRISEAFAEAQGDEPPFEFLAHLARELTGAEAAAICLREAPHGRFVLKAMNRSIPRIAPPPGELALGAVQTRLTRYDGGRPAPDHHPFAREEVGSLLTAPILSDDGTIIGALLLAHAAPRAFDARAETLAESVARQSAAGFGKLALYAQLARSEETLRVAVDSSNLGLWDYDIARDRFRCSPKSLALLGLSSDHELSLGAFLKSCRSEDRQVSEDALLGALDPDSGGRLELCFRVGSGQSVRWIQASGQIFFTAGIPRRASGTLEDVTVRTIAEREIRAARQAAEDASVAKNEFLASMSHEIRTPVGAVIGIADVLARTEPLNDRQKAYLASLTRSAEQLMTLVSDLLDLSKIESREIELESIPIEPARIVLDVADMLGISAREKGLQLRTETGSLDGKSFLGDPTRLRQILINLCSNAIKFTQKGSVTLQVAPTETADGEPAVSFIVRDTGIGIAPEQHDAVFARYRQADASITRQYGGTGLGLSIVQSLVGLMEGTIALESAVGQGSTFTVTLPLARQTAETNHAPSKLPEPARGRRILVVEDHGPTAVVTAELLGADGHRHDLADTGQQALDLLARESYDLVLMDIELAGIDGIETVRRIRQREAALGLGAVPIIGLTAHALRGDRERCLNAGMDDYLPKPFSPGMLQQKMAALLSQAQ